MSHIEPFIIPIPQALLNHPDKAVGSFFKYFVKWAHDIGKVLEQGNAIENIELKSLYPVQSFEIEIIPYSTAVDYTIAGPAVIIATAAITITLDPNPFDGQTATIKRRTTAGTVTISGAIDEGSSYSMLANYEAIDLVFSAENSEWSIV